MRSKSLLVANRGEVAVRVIRAAADLGLRTVAIFSEEDAQSLHTRKADEARPLGASGARAYLDTERILTLARETGCDAVHPGYGFLSESPGFARRCALEGMTFVGPRPEALECLGDKPKAVALAERCGVPVVHGTSGPTTVREARAFLSALGDRGAIVIKAVVGGGGRGMRIVRGLDEVEEAWQRCRSEARAAFGNGDVYVEEFVPRARHVEVQVAGDRSGTVIHLWERECSLQRRNQKLVEIAPSPGLPRSLRDAITNAAVRIGREAGLDNLGTLEFLIDASILDADPENAEAFAFIEANPRLQVEHTVTEEVTGIDLVELQLQLAAGGTLATLGLTQDDVRPPRGYAIQVRVNTETMGEDGIPRPTAGTLSAFEVPSGPGVRTDTHGYTGYTTSPSFDSLLAKVIGHSSSPDFAEAVSRTYRALCEFKVEGVPTNIPFLQALLRHPDLVAHRVYTRFIDDHAAELVARADDHRRLFFPSAQPAGGASTPRALAGARIDATDPLAVLEHGKSGGPSPLATGTGVPRSAPAPTFDDLPLPEGTVAIRAPVQGTIVSVDTRADDRVHQGQALLVMESMKMEHVVSSPTSGVVREVVVSVGDTVFPNHPLVILEEAEVEAAATGETGEIDLDHVRPDLEEVRERHAKGLDERRSSAVARRRKTGQRTARENVEDLCDPGTFIEYGPLAIAAQRRRRSLDDLIENTPADGLVAGVGAVNGELFDEARARCIVMSYDYTVLAGTQGLQNHRKKDRMFTLAADWQLPLVIFTEGGGGRPGDTDGVGVAGLDCFAFQYFGRLSGLVPLVGINSGRCFAGNAALLGCCDVVIATENSNIGMGGPAMIEGGGLGVFRPEEVGPMDVQVPNGVVDIPVADEAEAVRVARRYLSYFQGSLDAWECADPRRLRRIIPENRLRIYDVREVIETLVDTGSVLELRRHFGLGMVTALARLEGRPFGIVANNPTHLAGAIDSDAADKAARFMQLCDAFDLPLLFLCDTPGIMVGPEIEKTALVRHAARMFVTGASLDVPFFTIVLRKGYGLGAQAMAGGSFKAPFFTVAWPTAEFGGMGLEGAVKLGFRKELAAIDDAEERRALYAQMVERMYEHGKAVNTASHFELDDVIDPADSRRWILRALRSVPPRERRRGRKRPCIDTW